MKPEVKIFERPRITRVEVTHESGESYLIEITDKGMQITSQFDDTHMAVRSITSNQIIIAQVEKIYL